MGKIREFVKNLFAQSAHTLYFDSLERQIRPLYDITNTFLGELKDGRLNALGYSKRFLRSVIVVMAFVIVGLIQILPASALLKELQSLGSDNHRVAICQTILGALTIFAKCGTFIFPCVMLTIDQLPMSIAVAVQLSITCAVFFGVHVCVYSLLTIIKHVLETRYGDLSQISPWGQSSLIVAAVLYSCYQLTCLVKRKKNTNIPEILYGIFLFTVILAFVILHTYKIFLSTETALYLKNTNLVI